MVPKERKVKQYASDMDSNTCSDTEIGYAARVYKCFLLYFQKKSEQH